MANLDRLTLRVDEAAAALGISRSKTYALIGSGDLPSLHLGASIRVPVDELRQLIRDRAALTPGGGDAADRQRTG